jgi:hypothetical protein
MPISGAINNTYSSSPAFGTYFYQAMVTDTSSTPNTVAANTIATLTVGGAFSASVTPAVSSASKGSTATPLTAVGQGGTTPYSYQWYSCVDASCNLDTRTVLTGETNNTYQPATTDQNTFFMKLM